MAMKETPVITSAPTGYERRSNQKWSVIVAFQVKTDEGQLVLRLTGKAARELKALLDLVPPNIDVRPDIRRI